MSKTIGTYLSSSDRQILGNGQPTRDDFRKVLFLNLRKGLFLLHHLKNGLIAAIIFQRIFQVYKERKCKLLNISNWETLYQYASAAGIRKLIISLNHLFYRQVLFSTIPHNQFLYVSQYTM